MTTAATATPKDRNKLIDVAVWSFVALFVLSLIIVIALAVGAAFAGQRVSSSKEAFIVLWDAFPTRTVPAPPGFEDQGARPTLSDTQKFFAQNGWDFATRDQIESGFNAGASSCPYAGYAQFNQVNFEFFALTTAGLGDVTCGEKAVNFFACDVDEYPVKASAPYIAGVYAYGIKPAEGDIAAVRFNEYTKQWSQNLV